MRQVKEFWRKYKQDISDNWKRIRNKKPTSPRDKALVDAREKKYRIEGDSREPRPSLTKSEKKRALRTVRGHKNPKK